MKRRRRVPPRRRWSRAEDRALAMAWGRLAFDSIVRQLDRTPHAVEARAERLGLGRADRGTTTIAALARRTGYSRKRILAAVAWLRIRVDRRRLTAHSRAAHYRHTAISEENAERIVAFLARHPDGAHLLRPDATHTPASAWGTGGKPNVCVWCGLSAGEHYARGMHKRCYLAATRKGVRESVGVRVDRANRGARTA